MAKCLIGFEGMGEVNYFYTQQSTSYMPVDTLCLYAVQTPSERKFAFEIQNLLSTLLQLNIF